ncbi:MAG: ATP-binding cassette domain-containing protein [Ignavibacteriaceae bacterium]|nr:ATP-binding cassette domain-containing protein [Ignavibacteriaceae bacterium]
MNELLIAENISYIAANQGLFSRNEPDKEILNNISFQLEKGRILGIAGESGSGKTTLAKILAGIIPYSSGKLTFNWPPEWQKSKISPVQILFQNNGEILNPFRVIDEIIEEAIYIKTGEKKNIREEKEKIFDSVNFPEHLWNRKGFELSGGEQQRAALARIIAVKPELLILDEPFSAQDADSQLNLLNLFKEINSVYGITLICISHNVNILKKLCDEIIIIYKGEIVEKGTAEKIFSQPEHPYTKFLMKAESYELSYKDLKAEFENL